MRPCRVLAPRCMPTPLQKPCHSSLKSFDGFGPADGESSRASANAVQLGRGSSFQARFHSVVAALQSSVQSRTYADATGRGRMYLDRSRAIFVSISYRLTISCGLSLSPRNPRQLSREGEHRTAGLARRDSIRLSRGGIFACARTMSCGLSLTRRNPKQPTRRARNPPLFRLTN